MLPEEARIQRSGRHVFLDLHGSRSELSELSDGFQSMVALVADIAIGVSDRWDRLDQAEGIVLLDEIEVHLHPTWQIAIGDRLRTVFPHMAFVTTTHDPLCLKGLSEGEIVVLRRDEHNGVYAETDIPPITDLPADDLLTSFLFNLPSTRLPSTAPMVARYSLLLGKEQRTDAEEAEFVALGAELSRHFSSARTPLQVEVEQAVTRTLLGDKYRDVPSDMQFEIRRQADEVLADDADSA